MTEITDAEVAEVQWASSEEGKAAFRAAWEKATAIGARVDMAEVGAIVYAAHLAAQDGSDRASSGKEFRAEVSVRTIEPEGGK